MKGTTSSLKSSFKRPSAVTPLPKSTHQRQVKFCSAIMAAPEDYGENDAKDAIRSLVTVFRLLNAKKDEDEDCDALIKTSLKYIANNFEKLHAGSADVIFFLKSQAFLFVSSHASLAPSLASLEALDQNPWEHIFNFALSVKQKGPEYATAFADSIRAVREEDFDTTSSSS